MTSRKGQRSIAYNSTLNLIGFTVPMAIGLLAVPVITRELGPARFGLLSLAFAILEYSSLFDLGLGAATTREVSGAIARKDPGLSSLIAGSVMSQAALGSIGAGILFAISSVLVDHVFVMPAELRAEAVAVFRILALMIPATVVLLTLRGILEAAGRFDLSNGIRVPSSVATFLIPAVAASYGYSLPSIVVMLLITRLIICGVMAAAITNILPGHRWSLSAKWETMRPLFVFGGWMSVSNALNPILVYIDRFILAALVGVAAVGYYTAPFDAIMRLLIIPASLMGAVYPKVSAMLAVKDHRSVEAIYSQAVRKTFLMLIVPAVVIGIAGPALLELWLGEAFAAEALVAVRVLAVGVFFHAMSKVPSIFMMAFGRPEVIAKLGLLELVIHLPVAWVLISRFGVTGAALAWTIRVTLDAALLFLASNKALRKLMVPAMIVLVMLPVTADAQSLQTTDSATRFSLPLVTSDEVDRSRSDQLFTGVAPGKSLLMRSASSLVPSLDLSKGWALDLIEPQLLGVRNSGLPFSQNNSSMWAGRGISSRALLGIRVEVPHARFIFAPQIVNSQNQYWLPLHPGFFQPITPTSYIGRGYTFPYYFYTFPIDHPLSFGDRRISSFDLGESTAMLHARGIEVGVSNENEWWGPGIRNAMLLSNNAPGFPHMFVRTGRPISTPLGGLEVRWLVGALEESRYFDTLSTNDFRSIAAIGATIQSRWDPNLTFGLARSVYATADKWEDALARWTDVLKPVTDENPDVLDQVWQEPPLPGGRDQLFSLFARWVFPKSGAEVYGEWGRTAMPKSPASFLRTPNHTQGYTIGMQWRGNTPIGGSVRLQGEITQLEQSATFRDGPLGSWYTSSRVVQGYTHRGHVIGASIGPGASSQFLAADYLASSWRAGAYVGRIRTNEDVHGTYGFPTYVSYCNHDVSVFPGFRGAWFSRFGIMSADLLLQNRMNVLFQNRGGCPNTGDRLDLRNASFTLRISPASW